MVSKAWKNFINESLTELEDASSKARFDVEESPGILQNNGLDEIKNDKKSWCNTIDRSFGYAFKTFCRFVVSRTLNESSILKRFELRPSNFKRVIDRNFKFTQVNLPAPLPKYYRSYPRYARWYNSRVRNERLFKTRGRCNLSYFRLLTSDRPRVLKDSPELLTVEVGRYRVVKPVNQFVRATLSMAFE